MNAADVKRLLVVGSGTMGSQIAQQAALNGVDVVLNDVNDELLNRAMTSNRAILSRRVEKGQLTKEAMEAALARVKPESDFKKATAEADFVIEAVFERLDVKREVFAKLDALCPPETVLATNSSTIVISKIAEVIKRKDKACNMHFFHPVLVMELCEVVKGQWTSDETAQLAYDMVRRMGRTPILITKEISGFVVNRILDRLTNEAFFLAENGYATPQDIDLAVKLGLRHPMGPFELMDFSGLDVVLHVRQQRFSETGEERDRPSRLLEETVKAGNHGRKTGKGFYDYGKPAK